MDSTLRLYANKLKLIYLFVILLAGVVVGVLPLWVAFSRADIVGVIIRSVIWYAILLALAADLCAPVVVIFLIMLLRRVVLRQPVLQVDVLGWIYRHELGFVTRRIDWSEIGGIAIYRQQLPSNRRNYYLVVDAKHPDMVPSSRARSLIVALYPSMSRAVLRVPLNAAFVRVTPAKAEGLLRDIRARFAGEIRGYGIAVADEIQEM
jgi:hypothetical protein